MAFNAFCSQPRVLLSCLRDFCPLFLTKVFQLSDSRAAQTSLLRSIHRFSITFRSGDCEGHCKTINFLLLRTSIVDFEVYLGSLSICGRHPLFNLSLLTNGTTFASRICWNSIESILPSTNELFLVPLASTQPQSVMVHCHA